MIRIFQKIESLKRIPFPIWPSSIQRIVLIIIAILLFFIINKQLFNTSEKESLLYKKNTNELIQEIQAQQKIIQESTLRQQDKPKQPVESDNFIDLPIKRVGPDNFSMNFSNIPVRDLLTLLADLKAINLILSDTVQGNLTLRLKNISWQQALDSVLKMQGLSAQQEGNILLVAPSTEINTHNKQQLSEQVLQTVLIPIHYAKAADLSQLLQNKGNSFLSEQGSATVDERTNQLWVKDTPEHLKQIRAFLKGVDIPAKQVQIAARIVNVNESSVEELGLKFGTILSSADEKGKRNNYTNTDKLHMDMPLNIKDVGHFSVAIAKLSQGILLDLELSALEREGRAHTVSNPRLITSNRQSATIESGQEIPYQEKTASGATNISFKKAVLSLKVTPEITPENKILLNLTVNQDKVDIFSVNGVPAISTQQVQSQVLLNNGETIVLGGIYEQRNSHVIERIPFWGAIPVLGKLFSNKESHSERKELLVFITPKMIEEEG